MKYELLIVNRKINVKKGWYMMTDFWIVLFDLKENKQITRYFETEFAKDKEKYRIKKYLRRYIIMEDSSDKYFE